MKFDDYFAEPQYFTHGSYVVSGEYSREDAARLIAEETGEDVAPEDLKEDRVRFGFPPEDVIDCDPADGPIWYTGAYGHGSKAVWTW
jgi:hypothetical protein